MTKKWIAISLVLFAIAGLLGRYVLKSIHDFRKTIAVEGANTPRDGKKPTPTDNVIVPPDEHKTVTPEEFVVIVDKLVFAENRSNIPPAPPVDPKILPPEIPPLAQKPILVGTAIYDTYQLAMIVDPGGAPGGAPGAAPGGVPGAAPVVSRRAQIKKIGDTYQGYTLTKITAESIVLSSGSRTEIIPLHEGSKRAKGGKTPIQPIRLVSFGGVMGGGATGAAASSAGGRNPAQAAVNPANPQPNPGGSGVPGGSGGPGGRGAMPQPDVTQPSRSGQPFNVVGTTPTGGTIIQTPFGQQQVQPK
jgi:hypothetical protein